MTEAVTEAVTGAVTEAVTEKVTEHGSGPRYAVVVNDEEQYSIWPADGELPAGWTRAGVVGGKDECLDHIEKVWTDLRPRSVRG